MACKVIYRLGFYVKVYTDVPVMVFPIIKYYVCAHASLAFAYCRSGKYAAQILRTEIVLLGISYSEKLNMRFSAR